MITVQSSVFVEIEKAHLRNGEGFDGLRKLVLVWRRGNTIRVKRYGMSVVIGRSVRSSLRGRNNDNDMALSSETVD